MRGLKLCLAVVVVAVLLPVAVSGLTAAGEIVTAKGLPVAGVKVYALLTYYDTAMNTGNSLKSATVTDRLGRYKFASLPEPKSYKYWAYTLIAFEPGKWMGWTTVRKDAPKPAFLTVLADLKGHKITVGKLVSLDGVVVDKQGAPLAGSEVKLGAFQETKETCTEGG